MVVVGGQRGGKGREGRRRELKLESARSGKRVFCSDLHGVKVTYLERPESETCPRKTTEEI